jgi:hypothetical protein
VTLEAADVDRRQPIQTILWFAEARLRQLQPLRLLRRLQRLRLLQRLQPLRRLRLLQRLWRAVAAVACGASRARSEQR